MSRRAAGIGDVSAGHVPGGLVLAAGGGARLGGPKALIQFAGQTLVDRAIGLLHGAGCRPVVAVLGADADRTRARARLPADVVVNDRWETGMGSSLRAGLQALAGRCPAVVVALADQPLIGQEAVTRLTAAWRSGARVAVATYGGRRANPVLLDAQVWPALMELATGDEGARPFLRAHPDMVVAVPCDDTGSPRDVDTADDLRAVQDCLREQRRTSNATDAFLPRPRPGR